MKRTLFYALVLTALVATPAFAAYTTGSFSIGGSSSSQPLTVKTSSKVYLDYAASTNGLGYSLVTYHLQGNRTYASRSVDTQIYYQDATAVAVPTAPTDANDTSDLADAGWTAL